MNKRIMIVDDQQSMLDFVKTSLEMLDDYECLGTSNANKAISMAHFEKPDLIILDLIMPGIDGFNINKALKSSPVTKDIPVIFITGYDRPDVLDKIRKSDVCGYLIKPFDSQDVIDSVKNVFKKIEMHQKMKSE